MSGIVAEVRIGFEGRKRCVIFKGRGREIRWGEGKGGVSDDLNIF
jgi:hypothetical protein